MDALAVLRSKVDDAMAKVVKPTILVCGYTGAGKTSLIQAICGKDTVPDDRIGHGGPMTQDFTPYRNDFINLWDSRGLEPGDREATFLDHVRGLIQRLKADPDPANHVHLVWYTIQGPGARVTATDKELIRSVFSNVLVVITKNDITRPRQRDAIIEELQASGVSRKDILVVSEEDPESLKDLVNASLERLPDLYKEAFLSGQMVDLARKRQRAKAVIHGAAVSAAAAAALNPLPVSDAALITPIQYGMIAGLAVVYGLKAEAMRASAAPLVARVAGVMAASSLSKLIPGLGGVIQAGVASGLTEVIGQLADAYMVRCCEARIHGMPMPEFQLPLERLSELLKLHQKK